MKNKQSESARSAQSKSAQSTQNAQNAQDTQNKAAVRAAASPASDAEEGEEHPFFLRPERQLYGRARRRRQARAGRRRPVREQAIGGVPYQGACAAEKVSPRRTLPFFSPARCPFRPQAPPHFPTAVKSHKMCDLLRFLRISIVSFAFL